MEIRHITVLLTTYYGFRRSEVLGLRWSSVDFENKTISVERKVIKTKKDGVTKIQDLKKLKSKSSRRSLPLIPIVAEALKQEYARQQERKRAFGPGYYDDPDKHICVDFLGHPFLPDYVTSHYKVLLNKIGMRIIRFHDLRHPYVKHELKNNLYFLYHRLTKIFHLPVNLNSVFWKDTHLFNQLVRECLC